MVKEIENVLRRFVNIAGYSLLMLVIAGPVLHVLNGVNNTQIGCITVCAFVAALSSLIFISRRELQGFAWWLRELLCIMINLAVTLPITRYAGLWHSPVGMIVVIMIVIVIAFGNHLIEYLFDLRTSRRLNRKLKELR